MITENGQFIDIELLKKNCAGDPSMMRDLINMGLLSIKNSLTDSRSFMESGDWDKLARVFHKLRPVLCYCGVNSLTDELILLEENARGKKELPELSMRVSVML